MFVSIDTDNDVILHKHPERDCLSGLAFLEAPNRSVMIEDVDRPGFLSGLAHGHLIALYKNSTGGDTHEHAGWGARRFSFIEAVREVVVNMPTRTAVPDEVAAQVAAVEDQLHQGVAFSYVLGALTPTAPIELLPVQARPLSKAQAEAAERRAKVRVCEHAERLELERREVPVTTQARQPDEAPALTKVDKVKIGPKPSVRPIARATAEKAWEAAGRPTNEVQLKELTKGLIPGLEEQGFHPTTIRIKLAEWVREKVL